ncbi:MAG: 2-C-methyl-D-erythritol 4-phosphate cytidylyltransferase [Lachnospiraceae bacterium]|nr:2-C-methyl-D-erythritol 4-phosphate cytidylyltransferase [Lachnospiraceae bacterium]
MAKAVIFAGGAGMRMNSRSKPKQFLEMHGKPVIIYTIEHFEKHENIDCIVVVCISGWINFLTDELKKYNISKVKYIIEGGKTAFESIYKGLSVIKNECSEEDIILIHDGVRPLISENLITNNIEMARKYNSAITVDYAKETVVATEDDSIIEDVMPREKLRIAKAPQTFRYGMLYKEYEKAYLNGETYIDSAALMKNKGYDLHLVYSTDYNIKITTASDFYVFRAILEALENSQIFGLEP